jgi:hypothetical protein
METKKEFLLYIEKELKITSPEDWYKVDFKSLGNVGGALLLDGNSYNLSQKVLINVFVIFCSMVLADDAISELCVPFSTRSHAGAQVDSLEVLEGARELLAR